MAPHWTDTKNQSNVGSIRDAYQSEYYVRLYAVLPLHKRKQGCPNGCRQFREILLEKKHKE